MSDEKRPPAHEMTGKQLAKEWRESGGAQRVATLLRRASEDTDLVSMFSFCGEHVEAAECSVVVIRGRDVVRSFREWAERNGVLTPGKPVNP